MSVRAEADRIERHMTAAGLTVERERSGLSSSQYLYVSLPCPLCAGDCDDDDDDAKCICKPSIKLRVATHELPPTYGRLNGWSNYEVGPHIDSDGDWLSAVEYALRHFGSQPAPMTLRARKLRETLASRAREAAERADAERQAQAQARAGAARLIAAGLAPERRAEIAARWRELDAAAQAAHDAGRSTKHVRERRRLGRRALEAELGLSSRYDACPSADDVAAACME